MIRLAKREDFVRVQSILSQLDRTFFRKNKAIMMSLDEAALTRQRFDEWLSGQCAITPDKLAPVVSESESLVVGFMLLRLCAPLPVGLSRMFRPAKVLKIDEIAVDEKHRGQGHGTSLMKYALQMAEGAGAERISVGTIGNQERAVRFYRKHFKPDVEEYMFSKQVTLTHR